MYSDEMNHAYLFFLRLYLKEVQVVNKTFETSTANALKLMSLSLLIIGFAKKIVLPACRLDPLTCDLDSYADPKPHLGFRKANHMCSEYRRNRISASTLAAPQHAKKTAVVYDDGAFEGSLSYLEVSRLAGELAAKIRQYGTETHCTVACLCTQSLHVVPIILG
ncbi:hypothetical protein HPB47_028474 [Ixodes persulcatus]|uniref:Uncharacterized protein n=1 Tax=Ixodes persulcatus TaxID=34615 RepID=A0AC60PT32_IXOPE|nr:hypothetical protein HPB47_028474 [Ixodes persulcatus]